MTASYGDISAKAMAYSAQQMLRAGKSRLTLDAFGQSHSPPVVKPIQAKCRYCGAEAGVRCTRWRKTRRGRVQQVRHSPHRDRVHDALQATEMARTLVTGEEPASVKFR